MSIIAEVLIGLIHTPFACVIYNQIFYQFTLIGFSSVYAESDEDIDSGTSYYEYILFVESL